MYLYFLELIKMDSVKNVFKNTLAPITRSQNSAVGFALDTLLETVITWVIRYALSMKVSFFRLLSTVMLAAPLISAGGFVKMELRKEGAIHTWQVRFLLGLQSVPAYFLAQYIVGTTQNGFYVPKFKIFDILITIISRVLSRVVIMVAMSNDLPGSKKWFEYLDYQTRALRGGNLSKA